MIEWFETTITINNYLLVIVIIYNIIFKTFTHILELLRNVLFGAYNKNQN